MESTLVLITAIVTGLTLVLLILLLFRRNGDNGGETQRQLQSALQGVREEQSTAARSLREEVAATGKASADTVLRLLGELRESQAKQLVQLREELVGTLTTKGDGLSRSMTDSAWLQQQQLEGMTKQVSDLCETHAAGSDKLRETLSGHLKNLQEGNERKLDEMRVTVDEKLHGTLEKRLGESFALVSNQLEAVQRGLGEMQVLATGVGDLKRVLTNVKARGVWGEYQLQSVLEEILTPDQFVANFKPHSDNNDVVEYAIRLPGRGGDGTPVYLPIDSKFPQEDYQRLLDAADRGDPEAMQSATAALLRTVKSCAQDICSKYINPPVTMDFAIMFLPTEGLFAEVLRQPGLVQEIQSKCHILIAGPTTLAAVLTSLRMGFRTLAIEQRSSEVWRVLAAVKTEFGKFGEVLDRVKKQLNTASNTIEETGRRTRVMERKLKDVESLSPEGVEALLGLIGIPVEPAAEEIQHPALSGELDAD